MFKVDLHTHSTLSYDGGLSQVDYNRILSHGILNVVAITDHNEIGFALDLQKKLGHKIIVGEEIKSTGGDIIGLYLREKIEKGLSIIETVERIKAQDGLVYLPHPLDRFRSGLNKSDISEISDQVDIIEIFNARYITGGNNKAQVTCRNLDKTAAVGSDSHQVSEIGRTYNVLSEAPTRESLLTLLPKATFKTSYIRPWQFFNPMLNKLRKHHQLARKQ